MYLQHAAPLFDLAGVETTIICRYALLSLQFIKDGLEFIGFT